MKGRVEDPMVSCVMPTYNRRNFIPRAIQYFQRQDYANKELIIVDDGTDCISNLVPDVPEIRYIRLDQKTTLGEKLNLACKYASGTLIANWDDDDWYAPNRLNYQAEALKNNQTKVCGINTLLYYNLKDGLAYQYTYPQDERKWLLGSSLCYLKSHWEVNKFEHINVGMDGLFVWRTNADQVAVLPDYQMSVHMIHDQNISPKNTSGDWWQPYPVQKIEQIMHTDLSYYQPATQAQLAYVHDRVQAGETAVKAKLLKNVYLCLVHEQLNCLIDLVRNLHYQDPDSTILIFNGGSEFKLNNSTFPFEDFSAVLCPVAFPVRYGYLHDFALAAMEFALGHFSFDMLTIVDSDQLALRPGYCALITDYLKDKHNVGLLSNRPERLTSMDSDVWTSIQAFKEIELWRPFLKKFKDGEDKFVHWSFWPSTVFTRDACKDLLNIFKRNEHLQQIMERTEIWATEEIILPTLVSLLGYDIALNPCSHDFVSYQKSFSKQDLNTALQHENTFWIHPVPRHYDNELRKHTREVANNYATKPAQHELTKADCRLLICSELLTRIEHIEGWLTKAEAELIYTTALKACYTFPESSIVEVGSYQGKWTIILAAVANSISKAIKVYAVDPHDGVLGSADQGLYQFEPSLQIFKANIEQAELSNTVVPVVSQTSDVDWQKPIAFLLIDGLHDYMNVSNDFSKFALWVNIGGYVAFHDYADYFPDVQAFIHELLQKQTYELICQADSMIVLRKKREFINDFLHNN